MSEDQEKQELIMKNRLEALNYLKKRGFKISTGKFYGHCKQGLVRLQVDGSILSGDLERYAREQGLQRLGLDNPADESLSQLQEQKLRKEVERITIEAQMKQLQLDREQGKYLLREELDLELASRAAVFDSGLRSRIKERGKELVHAAGGEPDRVQDLVGMFMDILDEKLNEFCRMDRFQVIFEDEVNKNG